MVTITCMPSGFKEESEQEIKETVKPISNSYTWQQLSKYNETHNAHVAVCGKVRSIFLNITCSLS